MRNFKYQKKAISFLVHIIGVFLALDNKVTLPTRRCSERGTWNHQYRANNIWKGLNQKKHWLKTELFITPMKLKLGFLFTDLFQHFRIYLVLFALNIFIYG